jgi:small subunit ribosomal protein S3
MSEHQLPSHDQIRDFVIAGHSNLQKTQAMLAEYPTLLNVAYKWKENDLETAIQGAAHVGNVAIAEFLLTRGAPLEICTAAMLGRKKDVEHLLHEDLDLKESLRERLKAAGVSSIEVERPGGSKLRITIHTSRPGIIIGRKGAEIEKLKGELAKKTGREVFIDIQEVHKPELDAQLVAESIALQLERRVAFRRAMKKGIESAMRFGGQGVKIRCAGRLNGAEIARDEWYQEGRLPLHTLKADIDYGFAEANTTYGKIGVKVWLYKGEMAKARSRRREK